MISWLDVKLSLRMLVKHPGLTIIGGLGIAAGVALSAGSFAFLIANAYPVLPLEEGDRIVSLENRDVEADQENRQALHDFETWRSELTSVEDIGAFRTVALDLRTGDGPPSRVEVAEMSAAGFRLARVAPLLGRYILEDDERADAPAVVVIGYDVWQNRLGADPAIIGRTVRLGRTIHTVIGVMPEGFAFPLDHAYWLPLRARPSAYARLEGPEIFIFGRLAPGVTMAQAQAELTVIGERAAAEFPETNARLRPMVMPYTYSLIDIQGFGLWQFAQAQFMMSLLLIAVGLNVAILVYARTAMRLGEFTVRTALGASRARIVGQMFVEALILCVGATALGLALAQFGARQGTLIMETEVGVPFWTDYGLRGETVLFTAAIALFVTAIVGVIPAIQATGPRLQSDLRQLGGGTGVQLGKVWTLLIVAQVAIAVAALPAAMNVGFKEIRGALTRPAFPVDEILVATVAAETAPEDPGGRSEDVRPFGPGLRELLATLRSEPAVAAVTFTSGLPGRSGGFRVEAEDVPASVELPSGATVTSLGLDPSYFDVFDIPVVLGPPSR